MTDPEPTDTVSRIVRQDLRYLVALILLAPFVWRLVKILEHFAWADVALLVPLLVAIVTLVLPSDQLDKVADRANKALDVVLDHVPGFHKEGT